MRVHDFGGDANYAAIKKKLYVENFDEVLVHWGSMPTI